MLQKYVEKFNEYLFNQFKKEDVFRIPVWFAFLLLLYFRNKPFTDVREMPNDELTGIQAWIHRRCWKYDFTFPLPQKIYDRIHRGEKLDRGKFAGVRLKEGDLVTFYDTLESVLQMQQSEVAVLHFLMESNVIPHKMRKHLAEIRYKMTVTSHSFYELLQEKGETFGKFETTLLKNVSESGNVATVLTDLIDNLKRKYEIEKVMNSSMRSLYMNIVFSVVTVYASFAFLIPQVTTIFVEPRPVDIEFLDRLGGWLSNPTVVVVTLVLAAGIVLGLKYVKNSLFMGYMALKLPKMGEVNKFTECLKFMTNLYFEYEYVVGNENEKIRNSMDVLSNRFVERLFRKDFDYMIEAGEEPVWFFKDNNLFDPLVLYRIQLGTETGRLSEKIRDLYYWYKVESDNMLREVPGVIASLSFTVLVGAIILVGGVLVRIELMIYTGSGMGLG